MGHTLLGPLAFWEGHETALATLLVYAGGFALYALLVGAFYLTLRHRNLLPERPGLVGTSRSLRFVVLFPLISFGMFLMLGVALFFLVKQGQADVPEILLLSMAIVAAVRITAYLSLTVAEDLGKTVPLGLLGVILVNPGYLTLATALDRLRTLPEQSGLVLAFFAALVLLEVGLRFLWVLTGGPARAARRDAVAQRQARLAVAQDMAEERARRRDPTPGAPFAGGRFGDPGAERPPIPRAGPVSHAPPPPLLEDLDA